MSKWTWMNANGGRTGYVTFTFLRSAKNWRRMYPSSDCTNTLSEYDGRCKKSRSSLADSFRRVARSLGLNFPFRAMGKASDRRSEGFESSGRRSAPAPIDRRSFGVGLRHAHGNTVV